jgi:small-conductance mechanosensitive channel
LNLETLTTGIAALFENFIARTPGTVIGFIALALAVAAALALHGLIGRVLKKLFGARPFMLMLLSRTRGPSRLALTIFVIALLLPALPISWQAAELIVRLLGVVFVLLIGWIALAAVDLAASVYLLRFRLDTADNLLARKHVTQVRILKRVAATVVVIVAVAAALMTFESVRQYGVSLFASAGAAGLIVGLAARPLLSNLIAGVQLAVTQPIRIDDAVIIENEWGVIEEITATYVVVRVWDLRRLIVPLTYFIEKPFQNWTRDSTDIIGVVTIHADYAVAVERVRKKLDEIVAASPLWDRRTVVLQVTDADARSVELRALVSAASAGAAFDLRCEVREKLIAFLRDEYPQALPTARTAISLSQPAAESQASPLRPPRRAGVAG